MNRAVEPNQAGAAPGAVRGVIRMAVATLVWGAVLFLVAGTVRWVWGWIYLAIVTAVLGVYSRTLLKIHPDLVLERQHPPATAKSWDKPFAVLVGVVGPIALLALSALDYRLRLSPATSPWAHVAGLSMVAAGGWLGNWAVVHNRFFSGVVRIQRDRGHVVVDSGPYRLVRHPGYAGSMLNTLGTPLALGSAWALVVAVAICAVLAVRTVLEDRTLREELEGYEAYSRRVRYRLVPWVW